MEPRTFKSGGKPEKEIQNELEVFLKARGWFVKCTHGGMYQAGFPDMYCSHEKHGIRWIEVKLPEMKGSKFTKAQKETFPQMCNNGSPIWILTAATESEYRKLFEMPQGNFLEYQLLYHW